jgi:hypothetical protein
MKEMPKAYIYQPGEEGPDGATQQLAHPSEQKGQSKRSQLAEWWGFRPAKKVAYAVRYLVSAALGVGIVIAVLADHFTGFLS